MSNEDHALMPSEMTQKDGRHYLCFKENACYSGRVEMGVQVMYHERNMTAAFVRQAARDVSAYLMQIADMIEDTRRQISVTVEGSIVPRGKRGEGNGS